MALPAVQLPFSTDGAGRFVARGVCPGPLERSISHLAFGAAVLTATAAPGSLCTSAWSRAP